MTVKKETMEKVLKEIWLILQGMFLPFRIFFFLCKNSRAILKNRIIYPFSCLSFGHNIIGFELLTRLTYPHKASVIYTPGRQFNPYLHLLYQPSVDVFYFGVADGLQEWAWRLMRLALTILTSWRMDSARNVVYDYECLCNLMSFGLKDIAGHEELQTLYEIRNTRGFYHVVTQNWGLKPRLPEVQLEECRRAIVKQYPDFFDKPLATVLLRRKGSSETKLFDRNRSVTVMETYSPAIEHLVAEGFHIAGTGETDNTIFSSIKGYYDLSKIDIDPKLLNLFLITECDLFLGQQSGPYYLLTSRGIQCILTNCMPYRMGSLGAKDLNLYKKIQIGGQDINAAELYKNHEDLVRGYHFEEKNAEIFDNTAEEILETVKEGVELYKNKPVAPEIAALDQKLKALMADDMRVKYDPSRMPGFILQSLKVELD